MHLLAAKVITGQRLLFFSCAYPPTVWAGLIHHNFRMLWASLISVSAGQTSCILKESFMGLLKPDDYISNLLTGDSAPLNTHVITFLFHWDFIILKLLFRHNKGDLKTLKSTTTKKKNGRLGI